jgi:hypothetical protein
LEFERVAVRLTDAQWAIVRILQEKYGVPNDVCATIFGCVAQTIAVNARKWGWEIGGNLPTDDERRKIRRRAEAAQARAALLRPVHIVVEREIRVPLIVPPVEGTAEELTKRMRELLRIIQTKFLIRLMNGSLADTDPADFQLLCDAMRQFERILQSMKSSGVKWQAEPKEEPGIPAPTEEELKALMDKIEKRIDELATRRAVRLAAEKLEQERDGLGAAGVDVQGAA